MDVALVESLLIMDRLNSKHYELYQKGRIAMDEGNHLNAIELLEESALLCPHFKTYECIGECYRLRNENGKAIIYFAAAAGLGPKQARPRYLLAESFTAVEDFVRALVEVEHALHINPNYTRAKELHRRLLSKVE